MEPSAAPLQETSVFVPLRARGALGCVNVISAVSLKHPLLRHN